MEQEKIVTTKFDKYKNYLLAVNRSLNKEAEEFLNGIALNNAIIEIIDRRSHNKRIPLKDYEALAHFDCPSTTMFRVLDQELNMLNNDDIEYNIDGESYPPLCADLDSCGECWKRHINDMINSLNSASAVSIKNIPDDDGGK